MSTPARLARSFFCIAFMVAGFYLVACEQFPLADRQRVVNDLVKAGNYTAAALIASGNPAAVGVGALLLGIGHVATSMVNRPRAALDGPVPPRRRRRNRPAGMPVNTEKTGTTS